MDPWVAVAVGFGGTLGLSALAAVVGWMLAAWLGRRTW
jgi:UPF0716 family protein affecting phage T7 exclusion